MASSKLSLKFRIFKNNELVGFRELTDAVIKIGKVPSAHLHINDESVSRMHAVVEVLDTTPYIIDLGSTRGTFVNGAKINKAMLANGDEIQIGDMRLELAIADATAPSVIVEAAQPVAPPPLPKAAPAPMPLTFLADTEQPGARAVEVATMLGDSVVDVKHCMDPRGGKVTPMTWGFLAGGLACLLASATAFYVAVDTAAKNSASLDYHTRVQNKPAYSHRPEALGAGVGVFAFGGLALGLFGMTAGLLRARKEKKSPFYRIGTAPGVQQPVEQAPSADFPMVAPSGDDFIFNYGTGMSGEMIVDGKSTPLDSLAAMGLARPSATTAGAIEVTIPANAKIRARAGQTTFLVSAVNKPAQQAVPLFAMERRTAAYIGGSLAAHLGLVLFLSTIPVEAGNVNVDLGSTEVTSIEGANTANEVKPPEIEEDSDDGSGGEAQSGGTMALEAGAAGKPDAAKEDGKLRIKDRGEQKQMTREEAIAYAENAGFMGSARRISAGIKSLTGEADFSSGFDGSDVYGPLFGSEGEGRGSFGFARDGVGFGGGCGYHDCGIVGTGRYKTIGDGDGPGRGGWGMGGPGNGRWRKREGSTPTVAIPMPREVSDGLDKAIIKRYVKRNLSKIEYCYETELLVKPNLEGVVSVQFLITSTGQVSSSVGSGMDGNVAKCVAGVVKAIEFPAPKSGGSVQVNYPFTFRGPTR